MFILGELFRSLAILVHGVAMIMTWLLIARIILSWLPVDPYNNVVQFLMQATDPIIAPLRRLPLQIGMLDLTVFVAFIILQFLDRVLTTLLSNLAAQFLSGA